MAYTLEQLQNIGAKPIQERGLTADQLQQMGAKPLEAAPKKKQSVFGKVAEFIAPTATKAFGKIKEGEDLTARDIVGSAL